MTEIKEHWASSLQPGDRAIGRIRHATDGSLNRHGVELIVVNVDTGNQQIEAYDHKQDKRLFVLFNELTRIEED